MVYCLFSLISSSYMHSTLQLLYIFCYHWHLFSSSSIFSWLVLFDMFQKWHHSCLLVSFRKRIGDQEKLLCQGFQNMQWILCICCLISSWLTYFVSVNIMIGLTHIFYSDHQLQNPILENPRISGTHCHLWQL